MRNWWINDNLHFILIHIKAVCHSKLHQCNWSDRKISFDAPHTLCRYTENHCYPLRPVASFSSSSLITSMSLLNWQQLLLAYQTTSRFFAWQTKSMVIRPCSFSGLILSCPKYQIYSLSAFGERTTPCPLCYHVFAHVPSSVYSPPGPHQSPFHLAYIMPSRMPRA